MLSSQGKVDLEETEKALVLGDALELAASETAVARALRWMEREDGGGKNRVSALAVVGLEGNCESPAAASVSGF